MRWFEAFLLSLKKNVWVCSWKKVVKYLQFQKFLFFRKMNSLYHHRATDRILDGSKHSLHTWKECLGLQLEKKLVKFLQCKKLLSRNGFTLPPQSY